MRKPGYWNKAKASLSKKDKVMKKLINSYKDGALITRNDVFYSLCKSIIGQQISVAAANSVFLKFRNKCNGKINPKIVNKLSSTSLRKCGLSRQKIRGIKDLAKRILSKEFNPHLIKKVITIKCAPKKTVISNVTGINAGRFSFKEKLGLPPIFIGQSYIMIAHINSKAQQKPVNPNKKEHMAKREYFSPKA